MAVTADVNDLAYWYPRLHGAGVPVPRTKVLQYRGDTDGLLGLLEGAPPGPGFDELVAGLADAAAGLADSMGRWFLRTGHTSGKHDWRDTCHVPDVDKRTVGRHVVALVEASALADMFGLPLDTWVARELLPVGQVYGTCPYYGGMPVTREYRWFVQVGGGLSDTSVVHVQPYWPVEALNQGGAELSASTYGDLVRLEKGGRDEMDMWQLARQAALAATGTDRACTYWSVDLLATVRGWYVTDMAEGERSFKYDPATQQEA